MSVIINELDVITQAPSDEGAAPTATNPARPAGPTASDMRAALRHMAARAERLRAT